jgi:biopolymer transport protein ExbD
MNVGSKKGARADINITPLIDVVLVLLIIFMVLVPSKLRELTAAVPRKVESTAPPDPRPPLVLKIAADGKLTIGDVEVKAPELRQVVSERLLRDGQSLVFFEADGQARYGEVVRAMDIVRGAGAKTLAVVTKN